MILTVAFVALLSVGVSQGQSGTCSGEGWYRFGQKCYKLFGSLYAHDEAELLCNSLQITGDLMPPQLLQIHEQEEQDFILDWVFGQTDVPGIWTGLIRSADDPDVFIWPQLGPLRYTNWAVGYPTNNTIRGCVEMQSELSREDVTNGEWKDVTCQKGSWVVCEKYPQWSVPDMVLALTELHYSMRRIEAYLDIAK